MAINGINSYGMGYYNYQSSISNIRLAQALSKNTRYMQSNASLNAPVTGSLKSSMTFMKQYNSSMSDLMSTANSLKNANSATSLSVTSSDEKVATATKRFGFQDTKIGRASCRERV